MAVDPMHDAERLWSKLVQRALAAYEDALIQGLCADGAWEAAVAAMRRIDLGSVPAEEAARPET